MLYDEVADPEQTAADDLRAEYETDLAAVVESVGVETVVEQTGVDRETVAALADGESPTILLEDAAAILALDEETPDAEAILLEARDHLLMGMTTAVLDVDTMAAEIEADLDGKQLQQKIEGREPATLAEYAELQHFLATQNGM